METRAGGRGVAPALCLFSVNENKSKTSFLDEAAAAGSASLWGLLPLPRSPALLSPSQPLHRAVPDTCSPRPPLRDSGLS